MPKAKLVGTTKDGRTWDISDVDSDTVLMKDGILRVQGYGTGNEVYVPICNFYHVLVKKE